MPRNRPDTRLAAAVPPPYLPPPELVQGWHPPPTPTPAPRATGEARLPRRRVPPAWCRRAGVRSVSCVRLGQGRPQPVVVHGFDVALHLLAGAGGHHRLAIEVHLQHESFGFDRGVAEVGAEDVRHV